MIKVEQQYFELIEDYRACFDEEIFANRYSDILDKYDYVVGDFGYDQLRLKGFYKDTNKKLKSVNASQVFRTTYWNIVILGVLILWLSIYLISK